jgi:hypothetical protein
VRYGANRFSPSMRRVPQQRACHPPAPARQSRRLSPGRSAVSRSAAASRVSPAGATTGRGLSPGSRSASRDDDSKGSSGSTPAAAAVAREPQRPGVSSQPAPLPATGRTVATAHSQVGQPVTVDAATTVAPRGPRGAFDISRQGPDGARTVITQTLRPDGSRRSYRLPADRRQPQRNDHACLWRWPPGGLGPRVIEQRSIGNGVEFVTREDGRREATLPDGRPVYRDRIHHRARSLRREQRSMIERTRYVRWWQGRPVHVARPVVRYYDTGFVYRAPVAYYRPLPLAPALYTPSISFPSLMPLPAVAFGMVDQWVAFASTPPVYTDPAMLMGDMQIWSGFEEGPGLLRARARARLCTARPKRLRCAVRWPRCSSRWPARCRAVRGCSSNWAGLDLGGPAQYEGVPSPGACRWRSPEDLRLRVREQVGARPWLCCRRALR